jgi:putative ABC transport system permease protein
METLLRDLRLGLRQLARHRSFSIAALLALTLGIGATSATFSVADAVLLHELPYKNPASLVILSGTFKEKGKTVDWSISQMDFDDLRKDSRSFADMSVFGDLAFNLEHDKEAERLQGELVSAGYFGLLGLSPAQGRFFTAEEDAAPFEHYVVVLGHQLWKRRFGGDPGVVGTLLSLNGERYRVVGIAPEGFRGLTDKADLWVPSKLPPKPFYLTNRRLRWLTVVARTRPGTTIEQSQQEVNRLTANLAAEYPDMNQGIGLRVTGLRDYWFGTLRRGMILLTVGACLLLLIACINVANLLLTRAMAEQRAHAIRMALGADRRRLLRQLLTQSVLLSLIGAVLGLVLARLGTPVLMAASGVQFQSFVQVSTGPGVIAAILAVALLCGIVFGLVPVWITFQANLSDSLTRPGYQPRRGIGRQLFQNAVVVAQVALALMLSASAGLLARDFQKTIGRDLGFRPGNVLTFRIDPRGPAYAKDEPVRQLVRTYLDRLATVSGVAQVEMSDPTLPTDPWTGAYFTFEDHASDSPDGTYPLVVHSVSPGYFNLLGIPLLKGQLFTAQDTASFGLIASRSLAATHWPGKDALGRRLKNGVRNQPDKPWFPLQAVVADVHNEGFQTVENPAPDLYLPILQYPWRPLNLGFLVRPKPGVAAANLLPALRREVKSIAPDLAMYDAATLEERLARQTDKARFQILLITLFTVLALVMAAVGIYGVVAFSVAQRRREIAIRMSQGADRGRILRMVVGRGMMLAGLGLGLGLLALLVLSGQLARLLAETSATDPAILGGTILVLFLVTLAANYFPARRAANLDPVVGLRPD